MIAYRPALRSEIVYVQRQGEGGGSLYDPIVNRRVNLGPISRDIVARLDGERRLDEVIDEVAAAHPGQPRAVLEHSFRALLLMNLVEGAGQSILARLLRLRSGAEPLRPLVLDGARFACQGSGACCQNYSFGPLAKDDIERIEKLDIAAAYPQLADKPYFEVRTSSSEPDATFLHTVDDRCVFLLGDLRCGLHAAFGPEAKPRFCRLYPIQPMPTLDGLKIYDRGECASFATSARAGALLAERLEEILALTPGDLELQHPLVFLDGKTPTDYGYFLRLQRVLCDLAARGLGSAGETLVAVGRWMRSYVEGLASCPLEPGQPDQTVEEILGRDPRDFLPASLPAPTLGYRAIARVAGELFRHASVPLVAAPRDPGNDMPSVRMYREFAASCHLLQVLAAERADPGGAPAMGEYLDVMRLPAGGAETDEVLRLSMRHQLFGDRSLIADRPAPGLLRLAFVQLLTLVGARVRARQEGAPRVGPSHLSDGHVQAVRMLRRAFSCDVFLKHAEDAWAIAEAAPSLVADPEGTAPASRLRVLQ